MDLAGLIAGSLAKVILPGRDPGGCIITTLIGVFGAVLGGFIASALKIGHLGSFVDIGTWLIAITGSMLLLLVYRLIVANTAR
jgi:uncharacterized membrane protein YeaQ/YmgE (transglycosylase-associated protein family)